MDSNTKLVSLLKGVLNATPDIIFAKDFLKNVTRKGEYFDQNLNKIKKLIDVSGLDISISQLNHDKYKDIIKKQKNRA